MKKASQVCKGLTMSVICSLSPRLADRLASSIHTIYRPLARSQRLNHPGQGPRRKALPQHYTAVSEEEPASDATLGSSEDQDAEEDFEESTPRPPYAEHPMPLRERLQQKGDNAIPPSMMRSGSMATVRLQRRVRLAEKLKQVFDLDGIEEVWAGMSYLFLRISVFMSCIEMPCWLLRSVCR